MKSSDWINANRVPEQICDARHHTWPGSGNNWLVEQLSEHICLAGADPIYQFYGCLYESRL